MRRRHHRPKPPIGRRSFLAGLGAIAAFPAYGEALLDAADLGVTPGSGDQTAALRAALERAAAEGRPLFLAGGQYLVDGLVIPADVSMIGTQGETVLVANGSGPVASIGSSRNISLEAVGFSGGPSGGPSGEDGLLRIERSAKVNLSRCRFGDSGGNGLVLLESAVTIDRCEVEGVREAGIFSRDSVGGLIITNSRVGGCGNGGILIWGSSAGHRDGSIVMGNIVFSISADGGGNGQNGNGVNVFNADNVIVADNQIDSCAFTAIRCNTTNNTQIRGNTCSRCGEVAIFSEFAFSGSVIANNIVDGAAQGISITNFDQGGRLAVCSGNIVRNILDRSPVNPDTRPVGIAAEADTSITGNVVENVPGIGISAGYGPFLRNVVIADNMVRDVNIGIGVTVVDDPARGRATVVGNLISGARLAGIAGLRWEDVASDDLVRDADTYPHVTLSGNTVGA